MTDASDASDDGGDGESDDPGDRSGGPAGESPEAVRERRERLVALLTGERARPLGDRQSPGDGTDSADRTVDAGGGPDRRRSASVALAALADDDPASLEPLLADLLTALARSVEAGERVVADHLLRCVGRVVVDDPGRVAGIDGVGALPAAVDPGRDGDTLRIAVRALFAAADVRPDSLRPAVDDLGDLATHPDAAVRAWSAGALGRLAATHPGAVAGVADDLRSLLDDDDPAVRHNAVKALGALVRERPAAVAPAVDDLRAALRTGSVAVRHNAAAVLAHLAGSHPGAVVDAAPELRALRDHENDDLQRIATAALARLASAHPDLDR